jgi:predicted aspartyl protease
VTQIHQLTVEDMSIVLTDEVLLKLEQEEEHIVEGLHQLSWKAIKGTKCDGCMRVQSLIQDRVLVMLIDSGSSTTFISQRMVTKLGLSIEDCPPVKVKVANGKIMVPLLSYDHMTIIYHFCQVLYQ